MKNMIVFNYDFIMINLKNINNKFNLNQPSAFCLSSF